jgi:hypothetical protein
MGRLQEATMLPMEFLYSHQIQPAAHQKRSDIHKHCAKDPHPGECGDKSISLNALFLYSFYAFSVAVPGLFLKIATLNLKNFSIMNT